MRIVRRSTRSGAEPGDSAVRPTSSRSSDGPNSRRPLDPAGASLPAARATCPGCVPRIVRGTVARGAKLCDPVRACQRSRHGSLRACGAGPHGGGVLVDHRRRRSRRAGPAPGDRAPAAGGAGLPRGRAGHGAARALGGGHPVDGARLDLRRPPPARRRPARGRLLVALVQHTRRGAARSATPRTGGRAWTSASVRTSVSASSWPTTTTWLGTTADALSGLPPLRRLSSGSYCAAHVPSRFNPARGSGGKAATFRRRTLSKTGGVCARGGSGDRVEAHHDAPVGNDPGQRAGTPLCFACHRAVERAKRRLS